MTLKNNRAPLLSNIKLYTSYHHMWSQTGVTVRKRSIWVKFDDFFTSVTLTFDLWPRPFAWTSLLSLVMTPENFMMIRWWEHSQQEQSETDADQWLWPIFGCKVGQSVQIGMKLELDVWHHPLDVYAKFQTDISQHVQKKAGKLSASWEL